MTARPSLASVGWPQQASAGFTLFETIAVVVLLGVLAVYAMPKSYNTSAMTLDAQARNLAGHIQRAQTLATTTGSAVSVCATAQGYWIQLGPQTCSGSLPAQISSSQPVVVALQPAGETSLVSPTPGALDFNSQGSPIPLTATQYRLQASSGTTLTVTVAPVTGFVSM